MAVRVAVGVALQVAVVGRGGRSRRSLPRTGKLALRIPLGTAKNECRPALRRRTDRPLPSVWMAPAGCPRRCWCIYIPVTKEEGLGVAVAEGVALAEGVTL